MKTPLRVAKEFLFSLWNSDQPLRPDTQIMACGQLDTVMLEDRIVYSATPFDPALTPTGAAEGPPGEVSLDSSGDSAESAGAPQPDETSHHHESTGTGSNSVDIEHDLHDHVHVDPFGNEYDVLTELPAPESAGTMTDSAVIAPGPYPVADTFHLHSNPGASHVIYLDFDGHVTSGTYWNSSFAGGNDIVSRAYDFDGNESSFSAAELERIQYIWQRVAEDFSPFDVNVTTEDPGLAALIKSGTGDTEWGVRVVIGGSSSDWYGASAGGVAYVGSFNWATDTPTFVFDEQLANGNEKYTAEAISHEVGHTLGLSHDGTSSTGYYSGHGSGETGWAPIMGSGYSRNVTQWSSGQYAGANNLQDDLSIITTNNGFGYRVDDHGNQSSLATWLTVNDTSVTGSGIIERTSDVDVFSFSTDGGTVSLQINPFVRGPNLDILAELYDASNVLIASSSPASLLSASLNVAVTAGQYFLLVAGVGTGDPLTTGYTDYASLGQYTITGTVTPSAADYLSISAATASQVEGSSGITNVLFTVTRAGNLTDATSVNFSVNGNGLNPATATDFAGGVIPSGVIQFAAGETAKTISIGVVGDLQIETDETFSVSLSNAAGDSQITTGSAAFTILNDDVPTPAGITVTQVSTTTTEAGGTASFRVALNTRPNADVTIRVASLDTTEGVTNVGLLTFTAANWNVAQTVTVRGVDDTVRDGNIGYTVQISAAESADSQYHGLNANDLSFTNQDNDKKTSGGGGGGKGGPRGAAFVESVEMDATVWNRHVRSLAGSRPMDDNVLDLHRCVDELRSLADRRQPLGNHASADRERAASLAS